MINKYMLLLSFLLLTTALLAQKNFQYERKVNNVHSRWGSFLLPEDMYGKVRNDFADIRIYGISPAKDSAEVAYWVESTEAASTLEKMQFQILNTTRNSEGSFFTFETKDTFSINQLNVSFQQQNYDWNVRLEGSMNQSDWFTIIDNYRLLAIKNDHTDYAFTTINFNDVKFCFFRLLVKTKEEVSLHEVSLLKSVEGKNTLQNYSNVKYVVQNDKGKKQTKIEVVLPFQLPVSMVKLFVKKDFDYFRTVSVDYVLDSFRTEKGWRYEYSPLSSGALNSKSDNALYAQNTIAQKLLITVDNMDNRPLGIDSLTVAGYPYKLVGYFVDSTAQFVMCYGNTSIGMPQYDIDHFKNELPENIATLSLGEELKLSANKSQSGPTTSLNKVWLWVVMIVLILLLGFFAFKMMKKTDAQ